MRKIIISVIRFDFIFVLLIILFTVLEEVFAVCLISLLSCCELLHLQ